MTNVAPIENQIPGKIKVSKSLPHVDKCNNLTVINGGYDIVGITETWLGEEDGDKYKKGINLLGKTDPVGEVGVWQFMQEKMLMCRRKQKLTNTCRVWMKSGVGSKCVRYKKDSTETNKAEYCNMHAKVKK